MKVLVTGGMGFIGSHFVRLLLAERPDWSIVNLDLLTYAANPDNLAGVTAAAEESGRYGFVRGDVADAGLVARVVDGIDAVVNFAAETHVDRSIDDASAFVRANVVGAQVLLDAALRGGVGRYVQVSTDEVYGDLAADDPPATEATRLAPSSPYSASKAAADLLALAYHRTHGLDVVVTRGSNCYGPRQYPEKLIPLIVIGVVEGRRLPVYGRGTNVRDWLAVEDHCRGVLAVLEHGRAGAIYNLGSGRERTNLDVVREVVRLAGGSEDAIEFVVDRPGHDARYAIDSTLAREELGWEPRVAFEDGIAETVEWYLVNRGWWEGVRQRVHGESERRIASWSAAVGRS